MKFVGASLLLVSLVVSLQAGKVDWGSSGSPTIAGTAGQGCSQSGVGPKDKNTTKTNCS